VRAGSASENWRPHHDGTRFPSFCSPCAPTNPSPSSFAVIRAAQALSTRGGAKGASRLGRPIKGTFWLAGEAADAEGRNGTVNGAIGSGRRAAESFLESHA
jgi:hypothetical protein